MLDLTHGIYSDNDNYFNNVFPRQRPSLEGLNSTWVSEFDYEWAATIETNSIGDPWVDGWSGVGSCHGSEGCSVVSLCLNSTTARLVIADYNTTDMDINRYMDYNDSSCFDWSYLISFETTGGYWGSEWLLDTSLFRDTKNYECVSRDVYQWVHTSLVILPSSKQTNWSRLQGFSYAWLILVASINTVWLSGTYALYLDTKYNSELVRKGRSFGIWRAILDLAESLRSDLGPHTCAYSEKELKAKIEKLGPVRYRVTGRDIRHIGLISERENGKDGEGQEQGKLRLDWDGEYGEKDH
jgi:hypothetical protein